ncbi:RHS repeat-associated core domain-containing protein [bacterium SCSIO 12696]|nr:RHS repeat-associated core domain-containing protein [bacterium SCSIO 12696]
MDYYSYGYDGPGNRDYRAVYHSSGKRTYLYKNVWGQITRLRQWGTQNGYSDDKSQYFYYDFNQRLCRYYVPEEGATKYQYDAAGQVVAYAKGQSNSGCSVPSDNSRVNASYDLLGRLTTTNFSHSGTPDISRSYDANGNVLTINRGGANWAYSYNDLDMVTSENLAIDGLSFPISYLYNSSGHLTRQTLPSGRQVNYTTDGLGRIKTVKNGTATLASNVTYHPSSQVNTMTYGNGQLFSQTLTARLQPARILSYKGGQKAIDQTFSYDVRGHITSVIDGAVAGNNRSYGYDALGRLTSASGPWGSGSYTYDALGNIRQKQLGSRTVNLSYDSLNRVSQSADTGPSGVRSIGYDARGNVITLGNQSFSYDYADQPIAVSGAASGSYQYDGNLKRVKAVVNGKTVYNIYDSSERLVHIYEQSDNQTTDYISGPRGYLARITNNIVTYLHSNQLGSANSGTDALGNVTWRERYTPYGEQLVGNAANDDLEGFTGHIRDKATGLNYMQARYYDPVMGRFLSNDPVSAPLHLAYGNVKGFNRYAYANNNPLSYIDPTGRSPDDVGYEGDVFEPYDFRDDLFSSSGVYSVGDYRGDSDGRKSATQENAWYQDAWNWTKNTATGFWGEAKFGYNAVVNGVSEDFSNGFWEGMVQITGGRSNNSAGEDIILNYKRTSIAFGPLELDKTAAGLFVAGSMAKKTGGMTIGQWAKIRFQPARHLRTRIQTARLVGVTTVANAARIGLAYEGGNLIGSGIRVGINRFSQKMAAWLSE